MSRQANAINEPEEEGDTRCTKQRKAVQVRVCSLIKWSTPEHGITWREK